MKTLKLKDKLMNVVKAAKRAKEEASAETKAVFSPRRFSVRGLRKHRGVKMSRTPRVVY